MRVRPYVRLPADEGPDSGRPVPKGLRATGPRSSLTPERRGVSAKPPAPDLHTPRPNPAPLRAVVIGAAAVVIGVAAMAVGLFSGDDREPWVALPEETSTWLPSGDDGESDGSSSPAVPPSGVSGGQGRDTTAGAAASRPGTGAAEKSPAASSSPGRPSPASPASGKPSATAAIPAATDTGTPRSAPLEDTVLRVGDSGPEVTGLQQRLTRLWLFTGEATGLYDQALESAVRVYQWSRQLSGDALGEYGPDTRRALEAETEQGQGQGQGQGQVQGQVREKDQEKGRGQAQGQVRDTFRAGPQDPGSGRA
ncbi:peptidoglycan-binding domain-containing protein [Streptomyces corynorhini]|uniref:peptidoglycan-binding domain-containing protein n=1 Tax=Streptomyces corynorhini TaxID=2282652 RepID=UPI0011C06267|nr:peptidoglycan-binding domain-containing protein [Streptomyces corynorhini]